MSKSEWESLNDAEGSNFEAYDRALIILLTSTFGFSFVAVSYIVDVWGTLCHGWMLISGWGLLALGITLFLFNYYLAHRSIKLRREQIKEKKPYSEKRTLRPLVVKINWGIGIIYSVAILLIIGFVGLNLNLS